jgi:hypothetical protein
LQGLFDRGKFFVSNFPTYGRGGELSAEAMTITSPHSQSSGDEQSSPSLPLGETDQPSHNYGSASAQRQ